MKKRADVDKTNQAITTKKASWEKKTMSAWLRAHESVVVGTVIIAFMCVGGLTVSALRGAYFLSFQEKDLILLLSTDAFLLLILATIIGFRVRRLWVQRKQKLAGSRLHIRLLGLFGVVTIIPSILVAVFSGLFFHYGIESWFSKQVQEALDKSLVVAQSYLKEHQGSIKADLALAGHDLARELAVLRHNPEMFNEYLSLMSRVRSFREAIVFDENNVILGRSNTTIILDFEPVSLDVIDSARQGEMPILNSESSDRVRSLMRVDSPYSPGAVYLYVGRLVDPDVVSHIHAVEGAVNVYKTLEEDQSRWQFALYGFFLALVLLLLLMAAWAALVLSNQIVRPIGYLIRAAQDLGEGKLKVRVPEFSKGKKFSQDDEFSLLCQSFNTMAGQLETQRKDIKDAAEHIEERRHFTETVLSGVSSGVIGLDARGMINLPNQAASAILLEDFETKKGVYLGDILPEIDPLLQEIRHVQEKTYIEKQISILKDGKSRTFFIRLKRLETLNPQSGFVITFDDLTNQLSDQRKAAWADVARRIAHEIKNPLTPIQLSAQRLNRKYLPQIQEDHESFKRCVETILRQVETIGNLVSEFSSFARMPAPVIAEENLEDIVELAIDLQKNAHPFIRYGFIWEIPKEVRFLCDRTQINQLLTNLLQNAADSIREKQEAFEKKQKTKSGQKEDGRITIRGVLEETVLVIYIEDSGNGFPHVGRDRLMEPYYTTKASGTGLGLPIARKIVEDHGGSITLMNGDHGGAQIILCFPERSFYVRK